MNIGSLHNTMSQPWWNSFWGVMRKLRSNFGTMSAKEYKNFAEIWGLFVFRGILPPDIFEVWYHLVMAVRIFGQRMISEVSRCRTEQAPVRRYQPGNDARVRRLAKTNAYIERIFAKGRRIDR